MEPVLHQALVEWVSHALFFLTPKVICFAKMLMCLSFENRPVSLSFTHGVIRVMVHLLRDGLPCASFLHPSHSQRDQWCSFPLLLISRLDQTLSMSSDCIANSTSLLRSHSVPCFPITLISPRF